MHKQNKQKREENVFFENSPKSPRPIGPPRRVPPRPLAKGIGGMTLHTNQIQIFVTQPFKIKIKT